MEVSMWFYTYKIVTVFHTSVILPGKLTLVLYTNLITVHIAVACLLKWSNLLYHNNLCTGTNQLLNPNLKFNEIIKLSFINI